ASARRPRSPLQPPARARRPAVDVSPREPDAEPERRRRLLGELAAGQGGAEPAPRPPPGARRRRPPAPHRRAVRPRRARRPDTHALASEPGLGTSEVIRLNRLLLEEAYPLELADRALALGDGSVDLERCTVLGGSYVHRLVASECILDDTALVEDLQHGCVRF